MVIRSALVWCSRLAGWAARSTSRGWLPVARLVVLVAVVLLVLPPLINAALDLAATLGVWQRLEMKEPSVGSWWTWERVLLLAAALLTLRWFMRARARDRRGVRRLHEAGRDGGERPGDAARERAQPAARALRARQ